MLNTQAFLGYGFRGESDLCIALHLFARACLLFHLLRIKVPVVQILKALTLRKREGLGPPFYSTEMFLLNILPI